MLSPFTPPTPPYRFSRYCAYMIYYFNKKNYAFFVPALLRETGLSKTSVRKLLSPPPPVWPRTTPNSILAPTRSDPAHVGQHLRFPGTAHTDSPAAAERRQPPGLPSEQLFGFSGYRCVAARVKQMTTVWRWCSGAADPA